eukprot:scaffold139_cov325-Pavlova_lutheri.AAC.70
MAGAQAFLRGKSWHTQTRKNRNLKEEKEKEEEQRDRKRKTLEKELQKGAEELANAKDARADVAFMYVPPPTTSGAEGREKEGGNMRNRDGTRRETQDMHEHRGDGKKRWEGWEDPMRELGHRERNKPVGGGSWEAENQQLILDEDRLDGDKDEIVSPEAFQAMPRKEQRRLLRMYRKRARSLEKQETNERHQSRAWKRDLQPDPQGFRDAQENHPKKKRNKDSQLGVY